MSFDIQNPETKITVDDEKKIWIVVRNYPYDGLGNLMHLNDGLNILNVWKVGAKPSQLEYEVRFFYAKEPTDEMLLWACTKYPHVNMDDYARRPDGELEKRWLVIRPTTGAAKCTEPRLTHTQFMTEDNILALYGVNDEDTYLAVAFETNQAANKYHVRL